MRRASSDGATEAIATATSSSVATFAPEKIFRVTKGEAEAPCEAGVRRSGADINALRRVELVLPDERDGHSGQGLAAPADGRAGAVGTKTHVQMNAEVLAHAGETVVHVSSGRLIVADLRLPGQSEHSPPIVRVPAQNGSVRLGDLDAIEPNDHRAIRERRIAPALERHDVDSRESLGRMRRLEVALVAELHGRTKRVHITLRDLPDRFGLEQPAVLGQHPPDRVHLSVLDAGREPDAANGESDSLRRLNDRRARFA